MRSEHSAGFSPWPSAPPPIDQALRWPLLSGLVTLRTPHLYSPSVAPLRSMAVQTLSSNPPSQSSSTRIIQSVACAGAATTGRPIWSATGKLSLTAVPVNWGLSGGGEPARAAVLPARSHKPATATTRNAATQTSSARFRGEPCFVDMCSFLLAWPVGRPALTLTDALTWAGTGKLISVGRSGHLQTVLRVIVIDNGAASTTAGGDLARPATLHKQNGRRRHMARRPHHHVRSAFSQAACFSLSWNDLRNLRTLGSTT